MEGDTRPSQGISSRYVAFLGLDKLIILSLSSISPSRAAPE